MDPYRGPLGRGRGRTNSNVPVEEDSDDEVEVIPFGRGGGRGISISAGSVSPGLRTAAPGSVTPGGTGDHVAQQETVASHRPSSPQKPDVEYFPLMDPNAGIAESMAMSVGLSADIEEGISPLPSSGPPSVATIGRARLDEPLGCGRAETFVEEAPNVLPGAGGGRATVSIPGQIAPIPIPGPNAVQIAAVSISGSQGENAAHSGSFPAVGAATATLASSEMPSASGTPAPAVEAASVVPNLAQLNIQQLPTETATQKVVAPPVIPPRNEPVKPSLVIKKGDKGEKIQISCNFMRLRFDKTHKVYEYHVDFDPDVYNTKTKRNLLDMIQQLGNVRNFDGGTLFLPVRLEDAVSYFNVKFPDQEQGFKVTVTFVKVKEPEDLVQFFNILFRKVMRALKCVELRRNYYDNVNIKSLNQHKLEIWPGYCIAIEQREDGLMLCLDMSNRVLRTETVYDALSTFRSAGGKWEQAFADFIVGKIILTKYNNKCYKVDDVLWNVSANSTFERHGKQTTFVEYFRTHHQKTINDVNQPMLLSRVKPRRFDPDQSEKSIALVPELSFVTGLTDDQRANFGLMKDLGEYTRLVPAKRKLALEKFIQSVLHHKEASQILKDWNLVMDNNPMSFQVRMVTAPKLHFGRGDVSVSAEFNREATSSCFEPRDVNHYLVICTQRDADKAKRFCETYKIVGNQLGIRVCQAPTILPIKGYQVNDFRRAIHENLTAKFQFVLVLMPQARDDVYSMIKKACVSELAIPSQCVLTKTLSNEKRFKSVVQKIALQINCKLGGSLWALHMPLSERIMFVGIDVCHDPLRKNPSVLAVVATLNNECTKYYSLCQIQKVHQEAADSLRVAFNDALQMYYEHNNAAYPGRIIVWRDGGTASPHSFLEHEVKQILKSVEFLCPTTKFSFVVIQKRISQRFFKTDPRGQSWNNPDPGTVIDHTVTNYSTYDFFVVSQLVRQGTVTPTHYVVIHDTSDTKPDLMQKFAYVTSFMYFNWPGTVRVPAMTQYAHKLAALVGNFVRAAPGKNLVKTLYYL